MSLQLATVLGFLLASGGLFLLFLLVGKLVRPSAPTAIKASTYECGEKPFGSAWFNFNNRFYIIALVFVTLDVAVALLIPLVVVFGQANAEGNGLPALLALLGFLLAMGVSLAYVWARGDLTWVREMRAPVCAPVEIGEKDPAP